MGKIIIANWKMNPQNEKNAVKLACQSDFLNVVIAPPFPFFGAVKKVLKKAKLGAQDMFWEEQGAYTGEISPRMLKKLGAHYVIIGHSERRALGETDTIVNKKVVAALKTGLKVILCIGEPRQVRNKGLTAVKNFISKQFKADLKGLNLKSYNSKLTIAYEPVWAVSLGRYDKHGKSDTPENAGYMIQWIKKFLNSRFLIRNSMVLYGGSVNLKNAKSFLGLEGIDGALVGGASLRINEFKKIIRISQSN
ncbi:MAG: triose-phosphate isomerase [Patescibacteria group bacterium]|nr:triose-phosphate isomerase [Patescibacteria group bacterium]